MYMIWRNKWYIIYLWENKKWVRYEYVYVSNVYVYVMWAIQDYIIASIFQA